MLKKWLIGGCILLVSLAACSGKRVQISGTEVDVEFVSIEQVDSSKDLDLGGARLVANGNDFYRVSMKGAIPESGWFYLVSDSAATPVSSAQLNSEKTGFDIHVSVAPGFVPRYLAFEESGRENIVKYYALESGKWIDEGQYKGPAIHT